MVATMPRLRASSASSRGVQWRMGRADASGGSQASAMIWHQCSALKVAGAPGRGASCKRSGAAGDLGCRQALRQQEDPLGSAAEVLGRLVGTDQRVERLALLF